MTTRTKTPRASRAEAKLSRAFAELRDRAERRLRDHAADSDQARTEADTLRLVHELQVHQIELEMQNEELQRAREASEAALEKYGDLFDFAPVGYVTLDREGTILEANLTIASLLGIERARLIKDRFASHVAVADRAAFNAFRQKVSASPVREFCEVTILKHDKSPLAVRIEGAVAASGEEIRAAVTDVTERNRTEQDRLILSKLESTGILAGGIAHDFNNLLTVILLDIERVQALTPAGDAMMHPLDEAKKAALSARGLTQQLITFSTGGTPVRKPTRLSCVIEESVRPALSGSRVRAEFALAEDLWPAEVDEGQIGQVIRNLALNAREAMPEGGVIAVVAENVVLAPGEVSALPPGEYVRVSVTDRGGGIAPDVLPKVFDPYFSTKHRGSGKGMGLGLTICHAIMQKHGGAILVQSAVGVGTTFHLHLPACRTFVGETNAPVPAVQRRSGRILVMEDERAVRKGIEAALQRMGHTVTLVEDGQRAIAAYAKAKSERCPFDLVILDLTVRAGVGGHEAMLALRKLDPHVNAIVMSGHSIDPAVLNPARFGFKDGLVKPFVGDNLQEVVARALAGR